MIRFAKRYVAYLVRQGQTTTLAEIRSFGPVMIALPWIVPAALIGVLAKNTANALISTLLLGAGLIVVACMAAAMGIYLWHGARKVLNEDRP